MIRLSHRVYLFLLLVIFMIAFVTRFCQLGNIPNSLEQDETSLGYNAYSVLKTGKDEYGVLHPLAFKAFGEYKLPGYIYASIPSIAIFGLTPFAIRLPSAVAGFFSVMLLAMLLEEFFGEKDRWTKLTVLVLFALNPIHLHFSRAAFEVNLALFFILLGTVLFFISLRKGRAWILPISIVPMVCAIYTYTIARLFVPFLLLLLVWCAWGKVKQIKRSLQVASIGLFIVLLLPVALQIFSKSGVSAASDQLLFTSSVTKAQLLSFRSNLIAIPHSIVSLIANKYVYFLWQYIQNIGSYFSVTFFFLTGSTHGNHGIGNVGEFYLFELPATIVGIWFFFTHHKKLAQFFIAWIVGVVLIASLTREAPQATRSFFVVPAVSIFSGFGLTTLLGICVKQKNTFFRYAGTAISLVFVLYAVSFYFVSYYGQFPVTYASAWREQDQALTTFLASQKNNYDQIVIDPRAGFVYSSYLFYSEYPPETFQKTAVRSATDGNGFVAVSSFGNILYRQIDPVTEMQNHNRLIVLAPDAQSGPLIPVQTFFYPTRTVVLSTNGQIAQYPTTDVAYKVFRTPKNGEGLER